MSKKDIFLENRAKALWATFYSSCGHVYGDDYIVPMVTELEAIMRALAAYHGLRIPRVGSLLQEARRRMGTKGDEYQLPEDRWANFRMAVELYNPDTANVDLYDVLIGFAVKHAGDILKMTRNMNIPVTRKALWEKAGDWATYMLIASAMVQDEIEEETAPPCRAEPEEHAEGELVEE